MNTQELFDMYQVDDIDDLIDAIQIQNERGKKESLETETL